MFTDMVGYTAMAQRDESRALELLREHGELLRPLFTKYCGRVIKSIGDGFLVEFPSALDAAQCAVSIQRTLQERNYALPPEQHFSIRIGLHVGDVICCDGDVMGDGVNIASRLEALAAPGSICMSEDIARQVRNKLDVPIISGGLRQLRNVQSEIEVFQVHLPRNAETKHAVVRDRLPVGRRLTAWLAAACLAPLGAASWWVAAAGSSPESAHATVNRHSIAVLPFDEDAAPNGRSMADALAEEMITRLSSSKEIDVAARATSFSFKQKASDLRDVGRILNVEYVLAGSIRWEAGRVHILVVLIDAANGYRRWSQQYVADSGNLTSAPESVNSTIRLLRQSPTKTLLPCVAMPIGNGELPPAGSVHFVKKLPEEVNFWTRPLKVSAT